MGGAVGARSTLLPLILNLSRRLWMPRASTGSTSRVAQRAPLSTNSAALICWPSRVSVRALSAALCDSARLELVLPAMLDGAGCGAIGALPPPQAESASAQSVTKTASPTAVQH